MQIPIALFIDKVKGERDDFWSMVLGSFMFSIVPLFYLIISTPIQLYAVQFFYGVAVAFNLPAWYAIFTRHIDKKHEGFEWGIYNTMVGIGGAITASLGGYLAHKFGFNILFILVSVVSFIGSLFLAGVYKKMRTGFILFSR